MSVCRVTDTLRGFDAEHRERSTASREALEARSARGAVLGVEGVILAGTHEWGACALARTLPRPLWPVLNRPLMFQSLHWLYGSGIESVRVCANGDGAMARRSLAERLPADLRVAYVEDCGPRGPAGSLKDAAQQSACDRFVVVEGTTIPRIDMAALLTTHDRAEAALTVVVSRDRRGPDAGGDLLTPAGVYVIGRDALNHIDRHGYQDIKERLIPRLYALRARVLAYTTDAPELRVMGARSYLSVHGHLLGGGNGGLHGLGDHSKLGEAWVHATADVDPTARLVGPVLLGEGCRVGRDAAILGPTSLHAHCRVEAGAVVCNSIMWERCRVARGCVLERCVATHGTEVEANAVYRDVVLHRAHSRRERLTDGLRSLLRLRAPRSRRILPG